MKFNKLNVPSHWQTYWTRYPEGHTILEALIQWVSQVDNMVDNQNKLNDNVEQFRNEIDAFVGRFDDRLQSEVTQTLEDWQTSGFLNVVIAEGLQWQLDEYITTNEQDKLSLTEQLQQTEQELSSQLTEAAKLDKNSIVSKVTHEDVTYSVFRSVEYNTTYSITTIPYKGVDGTIYKPQVGFIGPKLNSSFATPSTFAKKEKAVLTINGGAFFYEHMKTGGMFIKDGEVLQEYLYLNEWNSYVLGIKADNTLKAYPKGTTSSAILADGVVNALTGFVPIIENGAMVSDSVLANDAFNNERHPRQVIAQMPNKDILILTSDGRIATERGLTQKECAKILLEYGVVFAYNLDGGGSATTVIKNKKMNREIDPVERAVPNFIYFKKEVSGVPFVISSEAKTLNTNGKKGVWKLDKAVGKSVVSGNNIISMGDEFANKIKLEVTTNGVPSEQYIYLPYSLKSIYSQIADEYYNGQFIKRVDYQLFNGSEDWLHDPSTNNETINHFQLYHTASMPYSHIMSTLFGEITAEEYTGGTKEGFCKFGNYLGLAIARSRVDFNVTAEFKTWLTQNPIGIVYGLREPIITNPYVSPIIIADNYSSVRVVDSAVETSLTAIFDTSLEGRLELLEYLQSQGN